MALEALIDRLEAQIRDARKTPLVGGVRVDRDAVQETVSAIADALDELVTPLGEDRFARKAAGVRAPLEEFLDAILDAPGKGKARIDRERLLALVRRMREGVPREEIVTRAELEPPYNPRPMVRLVEQLEELLARAKNVPLTTQARIEKDPAYELIDQMRGTLPEVARRAGEPQKTRLLELLPVLDELDDVLHNAAPVPLTPEVRIERSTFSDILQRIRAAFVQGTLAALTN